MRPTFIVGDVHGCRLELEKLLKKAGYHRDMRLIFVGDLINKGPDSRGVLELFERLEAEAVQGNHELGYLHYVRSGQSGKPDFDAVTAQLGSDREKWLAVMEQWPLFIEEEQFMVVHAGLVPNQHPSQTSARLLTRIRTWDGLGNDLNQKTDPAWYHYYKGSKLVVYGHWALAGLKRRNNTVGLDSGCVYGGQLSGLLLPQREVVSVQAKAVYRKPGM